jgi:hypothetical protein
MPVPTLITDLSTTAGSNSPAGTDAIGTDADNYVRAHAAFIAQLRDSSRNLILASAGAPTLAFTGDTNTGIFSPGADIIAIATGRVERLRIDATGRILNSSNTQPAFLATGSATTNAGSNVELNDYAAEVYDYGACFNPTTGRYTAPVAGLYTFTFTIYGTGIASSGYTAQLFKNGGSVAGAPPVYPEHVDTDVYAMNTVQLVLAANDYVSVFANSGSASKTLNCTSFFGRLLG